MQRLIVLSAILIIIVWASLALTTQPTQALPEYSAQTGEPCGTCHLSPSGGGLRTPRGQAWVGADRPGQVPDLTGSLSLLGVHLEANESDYIAPATPIPPAAPLQFKAGQARKIHEWLRNYEGN